MLCFHCLEGLCIWVKGPCFHLGPRNYVTCPNFPEALRKISKLSSSFSLVAQSCPSTTPRVYSNSCPLSRWCHPTISSSVVPFSSRLQSFPASGSFPMSQLFPSGGDWIGASGSVLPMNIQGWFPLGRTGVKILMPQKQHFYQEKRNWRRTIFVSNYIKGTAVTSP